MIKITALVCSLSAMLATPGAGFEPASHVTVLRNVSVNLPADSLVRKSLAAYPQIAAWGAQVPDLNFVRPHEILGCTSWSDRFHQEKVGSFSARLLQKALASGDLKQIAFAAGWVTHVAGDLGCHGFFEVSEATGGQEGVSPLSSRKRHLESIAEPYVWSHFGKRSPTDYARSGIAQAFSDASEIPYELITATSAEVYGVQPDVASLEASVKGFRLALETGCGYTYHDYFKSLSELKARGLLGSLDQGFYAAVRESVRLLTLAEKGDDSLFSNRWNLDLGPSKAPISNITVKVDTGSARKGWSNLLNGGTLDPTYFGILLSDGSAKEWSIGSGRVSRQAGAKDTFYLPNTDQTLSPDKVQKVYLRKDSPWYSIDPEWFVSRLSVDLNGVTAFDEPYGTWLDGKNPVWYAPVQWRGKELSTTPEAPLPTGDDGLLAPVPEFNYENQVAAFMEPALPTAFGLNPASKAIALCKPHPVGFDQVFAAGEPQFAEASFRYGELQVPMPNESVSIYTWSFAGTTPQWTKLGPGKTDCWGKVRMDFRTALPPGVTQVKFVMDGDGAEANAFVHVLEHPSPTVVFDLDGTLTQEDEPILWQRLNDCINGVSGAKAVPGAAQVADWYAHHGYTVLYLSARPSHLGDLSKKWLMEHGFPFGIVHTSAEILPLQFPSTFKAEYLKSVAAKGCILSRGYGDEPSDITAYLEAGITSDHIFTRGTGAGWMGSVPLAGDYLKHLHDLNTSTHP